MKNTKKYIVISLSILLFALNASIYKYQSIELAINKDCNSHDLFFSNFEYINFYLQEQNFKLDNLLNQKQVNILFSNKITKLCLQIKSQIIPESYLNLYKILIFNKDIFKDYHQVFPFHYFY